MTSRFACLTASVGVVASCACGASTPSADSRATAASASASASASTSVSASSGDGTQASGPRQQFAGAWSLSRIERRNAEGELLSPAIEDRLGYLIYDAAGYMGVTLMRPDRVPYSEDGPTADEALAQLGSYTSYFGRFTVHEDEGFVTHHLEGSLNPSGAGSDYQRFYTFTDDSLTLQPPPADDGSKAFLTWERLPDLMASEVTETHRQLFGAYRFESVSRHTTDGYEVPADQYETAYILYAPSGHMSVHLMRPGRVPYAGDRLTADEALMATETYGSYFGPFSVNEMAGCITCPGPRDQGYLVHHRVGSENPGDSGTDARRYYELTDTHLTLRPPVRTDDEGREVVSALRWARLSEGHED